MFVFGLRFMMKVLVATFLVMVPFGFDRVWCEDLDKADLKKVVPQLQWNQFRGPEGDGSSSATGLPENFDEASNVRWKTAIANQGWSSPVVWDLSLIHI